MQKAAPPVNYAIGDYIRLKSRMVNQHQSYQITDPLAGYQREPADGLILSIRDINTGKYVGKTSGDLLDYVIEIIYDSTFNSRYASTRNAPRTIDRSQATPAWRQLRLRLRKLAEKEDFMATAAPGFLRDGPLAKSLDGWKVLKLHSEEITSLEDTLRSDTENT